jgi:hypothetical protein
MKNVFVHFPRFQVNNENWQFIFSGFFKTLDILRIEKGPISFITMPISANGVDG